MIHSQARHRGEDPRGTVHSFNCCHTDLLLWLATRSEGCVLITDHRPPTTRSRRQPAATYAIMPRYGQRAPERKQRLLSLPRA